MASSTRSKLGVLAVTAVLTTGMAFGQSSGGTSGGSSGGSSNNNRGGYNRPVVLPGDSKPGSAASANGHIGGIGEWARLMGFWAGLVRL
jgi:hypothetical protein